VGAEFVKWDGYWQKDKDYPYLDGVEFKAIADTTTAEAALRAGEVDLMEIITDGLTAKNLSTASGIVVTVDKSGIESATWQLQPDYGADGETTIWDDINIRKAVAYALDFEPIINSTQYGYAMASNQWCMPNNWAYSPNVKGYPYDPEKAKECLAAAGYPNGFDTTLMCFSGMENVAQAIQGMLAEVGIKASIQAMAPPAMYEYIIKGGYKGLRLAPYRCNGCVPYRMSIYFTTGAFEGAGIFHSPELDQMFEDCLTAPDFETEKALAWKINEYLYDTNCAAIPMYLNFGISAKQSYVKDDSFATCGDTFWTPEKVWLNK
jgi:peptide/nickel transport system substrate-binding protein